MAVKRVLKWGAASSLTLALVVYGYASFLIASGVTKAERKAQDDSPAAYGLQFQDVEFISRKGDVTLRGWFLPGQGNKPTVIFVHGISGKRSGDQALSLAARLINKGFNVLLFDLRAHGDSDGDRISGGYFERLDVLGAYDFLVQKGVPPDRIGLLGFSMGAGVSLLAAAEEPAIRAVVADSPFADVSDLIVQETDRKTDIPKEIIPAFVPGAKLLAKLLYDIDVGALIPEDAVKRLPYPILVIHGTADTRIPFEHGVRVYKAAHPESRIWLVDNVKHTDAFQDLPDQYVEKVVDYFESRFGTN